jgi:hypothetical protein
VFGIYNILKFYQNACRCLANELFFKSGCTACPSNGKCDGSSKFDCEINFYKTDDGSVGGMSSCQSCPNGGTCKDNIFSKILPQSIWTQEKFVSVSDGKTNLLWRVAACPAGVSLERASYNPAGDTCEECPPGTYNVEGSRWSNQNAAPASFCLKCPVEGANCPDSEGSCSPLCSPLLSPTRHASLRTELLPHRSSIHVRDTATC